MKDLLLVLFLFFSLIAYGIGPENPSPSESYTQIEGKVIDELTGEGLAGVEIKLLGSDKVIYSDFDGNFSIANILPGNYTLSVDYISYKTKVITGINAVSGSLNCTVKLRGVDKSGPQTQQPISPKA